MRILGHMLRGCTRSYRFLDKISCKKKLSGRNRRMLFSLVRGLILRRTLIRFKMRLYPSMLAVPIR